MRLLADLNIAPRTVSFLRSLGHDVQRASDVLPPSATDDVIVDYARRDRRSIVTQDLDFSAIVALSGQAAPSVVSLRLASSRIEKVNALLATLLPKIEADVAAGAIVSVDEHRVRCRSLPIV